MNSLEIAEVFEHAADDVWIYGLEKGDYGTRGNARCSTGHLQTWTMDEDTTADRAEHPRWEDCYTEFGRFLIDAELVHRPTCDCGYKGCGINELDTNELDPDTLFSAVINWNDEAERTAEDVRDAFLLAAKELKA